MPELAAHVRNVPVNQIREITEAAWRHPEAIVLSIGEPGFPLPRHVLDAGMACLDRDETNYTPNAGIPALREAFAARFRAGIDAGNLTVAGNQSGAGQLSGAGNQSSIAADRVYVVAGAQQGLHLAMSLLLAPGDEILIPNPGYPTFAMTSRLLNAVPVGYPLYPDQNFQPRLQDVEALITDRTRVLMLNSPSNPLGAVLRKDLTRDLVELARRHDLWIISDECYEAFTYDVPHVSAARFDSDVPGEARVFTSLTLSKTYGLTGLRIGALVCPPGLEQKMNNVMEAIVSCVASPSQYAALAALTGPQDYVEQAHKHYRANRDAASAVLDAKGIPYLSAQGAFYLWADVSHVSDGDVRAWTRRFLAESGVSFAPGTAFGSIGEGWVRIALCGKQPELVEGVGRLPART
ncbi:pyridoxal phosphate-dependent aminotransferase [Arthrobacter sp. CDRTa11]|uniref:pyridoxal phosphate-dependent aminotransferase n=1 Tax=Arthrobacter sp. CDRTa11 TaxID=2651199 RepID=UPI00226582F1|nr:pyridoxal phosphate-dependent aminotransferase [Arthrobacter sp. CDRTa11]